MTIRKFLIIAMATLPLTLVGCDGSSSSNDSVVMPDPDPTPDPEPDPDPDPEPAPEPDNSFSSFVMAQFAATSDTADPEPVDDREFTFDDQQNPDAFSELFDGDEN